MTNNKSRGSIAEARRLSDKAQSRLNLIARARLGAISVAFKAYAKNIGAPEWASYDQGETARFVEIFIKTAKHLVNAHLRAYGNPGPDFWPTIVDAVLRRIRIAASEAPPLPEMVHTYPWRPSELFGREDFLEAMRAMIRFQFPQPDAQPSLACRQVAVPEPKLRANHYEEITITRTSGATGPGNRCERLLRKEGESWRLIFEGKEIHMSDRKGLGYVAILLRSPGKAFYCAELLAARHGGQLPTLGSAGESLDPIAFDDYRSRVEDLESQITEADRNHDQGRKELLQVELDQIIDELQRATGLGGRHRAANDDAERIRKGVCNAITRAIVAIGAHHSRLAEYLELHIQRGSFVTYKPNGVPWQF